MIRAMIGLPPPLDVAASSQASAPSDVGANLVLLVGILARQEARQSLQQEEACSPDVAESTSEAAK
jgi:hypothetical protein